VTYLSAMPNNGASPVPPVSSVRNTLRLLVLLEDHPSLRVVDVAQGLGVAGSTAHRLLTCLKEEGFLRQPPGSRHYVAGPEILKLARHFSDENSLERVAHLHLERLCREVNEAVNLQILVGHEVLCLDAVVEDRHGLQVRSIRGQRVSASVSAAGKVLLAALKPAELEEALSQDPRHPDPEWSASIHAELVTIREFGYATNMGEREPGVHAVAVPINDVAGKPIAALAVAAPSVRLPHVRIGGLITHLRSASAAITLDYFGTA
jgi:IclR family transcriptional regulator, acetate operon repressor